MVNFILWVLFYALIWAASGFLAAWTGVGMGRIWRRVVMPAITTLIGLLGLWDLRAIFLMGRSGNMTIGYGIPDASDRGSVLGRFWFGFYKGNLQKSGIAVRGTLGLLEASACLAVPWITGHWAAWIIAAEALIINNILFGELIKGEGKIKIFGKDLLWQEIYIHGNDSLIVAILIIICR